MECFEFDNTHILHSRSVQAVDRDYIKSTKDVVTLNYRQDGREAKDTTHEPGKEQNYRSTSSQPALNWHDRFFFLD